MLQEVSLPKGQATDHYAGSCERMRLTQGEDCCTGGEHLPSLGCFSVCQMRGAGLWKPCSHPRSSWIPNDVSKALLEGPRALGLAQRNLSTDPRSRRAARGGRSTFRAKQSLKAPTKRLGKKTKLCQFHPRLNSTASIFLFLSSSYFFSSLPGIRAIALLQRNRK